MQSTVSLRRRGRQSSFLWLPHFYCSVPVTTSQSNCSTSVGALHHLCTTGRYSTVVFQTRDYAHCDLPKHTVLAMFSWNHHESHFWNVGCFWYVCVRGTGAISERAWSQIQLWFHFKWEIFAVKFPDPRSGSKWRDPCVICKKRLLSNRICNASLCRLFIPFSTACTGVFNISLACGAQIICLTYMWLTNIHFILFPLMFLR